MRMALEQWPPGVCNSLANGDFLLMSAMQAEDCELVSLPTRDAVLPMLAVRASARAKECRVSALLDALPASLTCNDHIKNVPMALIHTRLASLLSNNLSEQEQTFKNIFGAVSGRVRNQNAADALRATFCNEEMVHLRPSEKTPKLGYYAKAMSVQRAAQINTSALGLLYGGRQE